MKTLDYLHGFYQFSKHEETLICDTWWGSVEMGGKQSKCFWFVWGFFKPNHKGFIKKILYHYKSLSLTKQCFLQF